MISLGLLAARFAGFVPGVGGALSWLLRHKGVLVALAIAVSYGAGWFKGRSSAFRSCEAAALRLQIAEMQRQRQATERVLDDAARRAEAATAANDTLRKQVEAYEQTREQGEDAGGCRIGGDDARRLRDIR